MYRSRIVLPIFLSMVGNLLPTRFSVLGFSYSSPVRRRVAEAGQGILTNMFEHVDAQRVRVYEESCPSSNAGYRVAAANRGRLLFGYFFFGEARKSD